MVNITKDMTFKQISDTINNATTDKNIVFLAGTYEVWKETLKITNSGVNIKFQSGADIISSAANAIQIGTNLAENGTNANLAVALSDNNHTGSHESSIVVSGDKRGVATPGALVSVRATNQEATDPATQTEYTEKYSREAMFVTSGSTYDSAKNQTTINISHVINKDDPNQTSTAATYFKGIEMDIPTTTTGPNGEILPTGVRIFSPVKDVTISDLNLKYTPDPNNRNPAAPNPTDYNGMTGGTSIFVTGTYNVNLENVTVTNSLSHGILIRDSVGARGHDITISGAYNKGGGSHGYGLYFNDSNSSYFTNVNVTDTRHAVLFSSEHSEFYNHVGINYTNRDVNFHGSPDYHNVVEVDTMIKDASNYWSAEEYYRPPGLGDGQPAMNREAYEDRNKVTFVTLQGSNEADNVRGAATGSTLKGGGGADDLYGNTGVDKLYGEADNDYLYGFAGNDTLDGGAGTDVMTGGTGDDLYAVDNIADRVIEQSGQGNDAVVSTATYQLAAGQEIETLQLATSTQYLDLNLYGNEFANTLRGYKGNNVLDGNGGNDTMVGREGDDTYGIDDAGDVVIEVAGEGTDEVIATVSYTLTTGAYVEKMRFANSVQGNFNLTGNELANAISGNGGSNSLDGKAGADTLTGNGGADNFIFSTALSASNIDRIVDFSTADDTIRLSKSIFTVLQTGSLPSGAFKNLGTSGATIDADDRILYNSTTGDLSYDADGSGSGAAIKFAILDNKPALTAADFIIV